MKFRGCQAYYKEMRSQSLPSSHVDDVLSLVVEKSSCSSQLELRPVSHVIGGWQWRPQNSAGLHLLDPILCNALSHKIPGQVDPQKLQKTKRLLAETQ